MLALERHLDDEARRGARDELVGHGEGESLRGVFGIERMGERRIKLLLLLGRLLGFGEVAQGLVGGIICTAAHDFEDCAAQISGERAGLREKLLVTGARFGQHRLITEEAELTNDGGPQQLIERGFFRARLPPEAVELWPEKLARPRMKTPPSVAFSSEEIDLTKRADER